MRLLLFDDNPDYGGHQVMTRHALAGVLEHTDWQVLALGDPANTRNWEGWQVLAEQWPLQLKLQESPTRTRKLQALRNYWQWNSRNALRQQILKFAPDLVLCSQGNIEQCSSLFWLAGRLRCPLVSYIPLPHSHAEMGAQYGAVRDVLCRPLYRKPDVFITLSPTLAEVLRQKGAQAQVMVVENGIPAEKFPAQPDRGQARSQLQLPADGFLWLLPGRTEFKQKGQDFALQVFARRQKLYPDEHLLFLGSGPDSAALQSLCKRVPNVHLLPWSDKPAQVLAAADALIFPSRYEGVPLVMLEALAMGRPVAATDRDGMRDWLPAEWRFPYRCAQGALKSMEALRSKPVQQIEQLQQRVRTHNTLSSFQQDFIRALQAL